MPCTPGLYRFGICDAWVRPTPWTPKCGKPDKRAIGNTPERAVKFFGSRSPHSWSGIRSDDDTSTDGIAQTAYLINSADVGSIRILLVADMRSPHAVNWARGLLLIGIRPIIVSSRYLNSEERAQLPQTIADSILHEPRDLVSRMRVLLTQVPLLLRTARKLARGSAPGQVGYQQNHPAPRPEGVGHLELPLELIIAAVLRRTIRKTVRERRPHLVHALRVPYEGIASYGSTLGTRFAISTWGSDLSRQAPSSPSLARITRRTLRNIDALHTDCERDVLLAREWGMPAQALTLVAPGNMGFDGRFFRAPRVGQPAQRTLIVFPRGPASRINYVGFVEAAAQIILDHPNVVFVGVRLKGEPACEQIRNASADPERIILTDLLSQAELAELYRNAVAVVSPSASDGTPNSVLEGMACGAVPIVGDIAPLRDLLMPALAECLIPALDTQKMIAAIERLLALHPSGRERLSDQAQRIASEWSRDVTLKRVQEWYELIVDLDRV